LAALTSQTTRRIMTFAIKPFGKIIFQSTYGPTTLSIMTLRTSSNTYNPTTLRIMLFVKMTFARMIFSTSFGEMTFGSKYGPTTLSIMTLGKMTSSRMKFGMTAFGKMTFGST
jgi:hypothetical protein